MSAEATASRAARWATLAAVLALAATLYGLTLYPGVGGRLNAGDSAKFQYVGSVLGVPHQPGYPQYVLLSYLWTRVPLPLELAVQVNLLSAVFALAAAAFLFLALEALSGSLAAAALGTLSLVLGRTVWSYATEAEVYALNLAWLAAVFWLAERWQRQPGWPRLAALLAVYALSYGNHPLMITLLPALAVLLLVAGRRELLRPRTLAFTLVVVLASAAQYGFLVWRSHSDSPLIEGIRRDAEVADLADTISGRRFTEQYVLGKGWGEAAARLAQVPAETGRQITWPAALLALAGAGWLLVRRLPLGLFVVLGILGPVAFAALYQIGDWVSYLTPAWALAAGAAAAGAAWIGRRRRVAGIAVVAVWALAVAWMGVANFRALDVEESPWDRGRLFRAAEPGSVVVTYPGPGYRSLELNRYYRFGLGMEERHDLEIQTATQVFEQKLTFLSDRRLYFGGDRRVKQLFENHRVDTQRRWLEDGPEADYHFTATVYPLSALEVRPAEGGGLEIFRDGDRSVAVALSSLKIAVVSPTERRLKGVLSVPLTGASPGATGRRVLHVLRHVEPGDWVAAVAHRFQLGRNQQLLEGLARALGHPTEAVEGTRASLVLWGPKWGRRDRLQAVRDPNAPLTLEVAP